MNSLWSWYNMFFQKYYLIFSSENLFCIVCASYDYYISSKLQKPHKKLAQCTTRSKLRFWLQSLRSNGLRMANTEIYFEVIFIYVLHELVWIISIVNFVNVLALIVWKRNILKDFWNLLENWTQKLP